MGDNIYKTTTEPLGGYSAERPQGYLAKSTQRGCCPGRKKRLQYLVLLFSGLSICGALTLLVIGTTGSGEVLGLSLVLALVLLMLGVALVLFYLRSQGRVNLPCWPSRAERFSRALIDQPPRSNTQVTLAEEETTLSVQGRDERTKLMDNDHYSDSQKIAHSEPKIVLMQDKV